ncbi:hypothetical protein SLEP1_g4836 [Rubroshorea leprosula]|uniref:Uncharacterized protein n=1 Tax=Rubroshorea leprosula TaxID=152421 RepID=A0AAV5HQ04_9ROSI|nr:hypothetical protein SLEP1_g4836 [Rubroshorea leprosula]
MNSVPEFACHEPSAWVCVGSYANPTPGFPWVCDANLMPRFAWGRDANPMPRFMWVNDTNPAPGFAKQTYDLDWVCNEPNSWFHLLILFEC